MERRPLRRKDAAPPRQKKGGEALRRRTQETSLSREAPEAEGPSWFLQRCCSTCGKLQRPLLVGCKSGLRDFNQDRLSQSVRGSHVHLKRRGLRPSGAYYSLYLVL